MWAEEFVSCWDSKLFEESSNSNGHVEAVGSWSFIMGDVDLSEGLHEVFDVVPAFVLIFDVGEGFVFMVDVPVTEGDGCDASEEEVALFAFEEDGVVDAAASVALGVASEAGDEELDVFEVASCDVEEELEGFSGEVGAVSGVFAENGGSVG